MTVTETAAITAIAVAGEACWATAHRTQHVMSGGTVRPPSVQSRRILVAALDGTGPPTSPGGRLTLKP